jgi:regulator of vacuolar morphogenesis
MPSHEFEISIPTTTLTTVDGEKPFTTYNITIRLPLRSYSVQKRYSDFVSLDEVLKAQAAAEPPVPLPGKGWFWRTRNNETLIEERRAGLERYLIAINGDPDRRWRTTPAWRSFLNLPSTSFSSGKIGDLQSGTERVKTDLHRALTLDDAPITDPVLWLDVHRELKTQLHEARMALQKRDQTNDGSAAGLEFSALAKKSLVLAGKMINMLESGLAKSGDSGLGLGEARRRRDLIAAAKRDREGLETLANQYSSTARVGTFIGHGRQESVDRNSLFGSSPVKRQGRVLGAPLPETDRTRELDNDGVLQLQRQYMDQQDQSVQALHQIVSRQRNLAVAINEELTIQDEIFNGLEADVDRLQGKMNVAQKRVGKLG